MEMVRDRGRRWGGGTVCTCTFLLSLTPISVSTSTYTIDVVVVVVVDITCGAFKFNRQKGIYRAPLPPDSESPCVFFRRDMDTLEGLVRRVTSREVRCAKSKE